MFHSIKLLLVILVFVSVSGCLSMSTKMFNGISPDAPIGKIKIYNDNNGSFDKWVKEGSSLGRLCEVFYSARKYNSALECLKYYDKNVLSKALQRIPKNKELGLLDRNVIDILLYYQIASSIYLDVGNYNKAYDLSTAAINIVQCKNKQRKANPFEVCFNVRKITAIYANKVVAAVKLNKLKEARKLADVLAGLHITMFGTKIYDEHGDIGKKVHANQARAFLAVGDYVKAESSINKSSSSVAHTLFRVASGIFSGGLSEIAYTVENRIVMNDYYMKAKICLMQEKMKCAKKYYEILLTGDKGLAYIFDSQNASLRPGLYSLVLKERGHIASKEGEVENALKYFKTSIDLIESQRASLNTEASKIGFVGDKFSVYRDIVELLIKMKRYDEALSYVERGKARALVDMLANKKQFSNKNKSLQVASLVSNLNEAENAKFIIPTNKSKQEITKQRSVNRALLRKRRSDVIKSQPELASLVTVSAPSISDLQKKLSSNETLVEYYGDDKQLYAFVMSRSGVGAVKLNAKGVSQSINDFRNALMKPKSRAYNGIGYKLYSQLISPVVNQIKTKNITFVPHGALHYLPFSALPTSKGHLIDSYNIRILPSASVMNFLNKKSNAKGSLLALGNPDLNDKKLDLPGAQTEAIAITSKQKGARLLLRKNATETAVKKYGSGYKYLHFASHGVFDPDKPLDSGLLLSKDAANDGNLTVGELYNLSLNADLVTLSACETALGKVANGDDVVGFTRGFLYAGAKSIVSSLWKVDDAATNKLMQNFYANLKHTDKRSALRTAQLNVKKEYSHPYYWAAFQLTGAIN